MSSSFSFIFNQNFKYILTHVHFISGLERVVIVSVHVTVHTKHSTLLILTWSLTSRSVKRKVLQASISVDGVHWRLAYKEFVNASVRSSLIGERIDAGVMCLS